VGEGGEKRRRHGGCKVSLENSKEGQEKWRKRFEKTGLRLDEK